MNTALILAAGVGQRMRNAGCPKQFLKIMGKPIIIYTLEKFEHCPDIDNVIVVCHGSYIDEMRGYIAQYALRKVTSIIVGGSDRQASIINGMKAIDDLKANDDNWNTEDDQDIVVIHDGVRPLVDVSIISENVRAAITHGCAATAHPIKETVVITDSENASIDNFKERSKTYTLTSPQTFKLSLLKEAFEKGDLYDYNGMPLLDAAMVYAKSKGEVYLVKELGSNIKVTTPEDFYYLKATLELEEQKYIFGL